MKHFNYISAHSISRCLSFLAICSLPHTAHASRHRSVSLSWQRLLCPCKHGTEQVPAQIQTTVLLTTRDNAAHFALQVTSFENLRQYEGLQQEKPAEVVACLHTNQCLCELLDDYGRTSCARRNMASQKQVSFFFLPNLLQVVGEPWANFVVQNKVQCNKTFRVNASWSSLETVTNFASRNWCTIANLKHVNYPCVTCLPVPHLTLISELLSVANGCNCSCVSFNRFLETGLSSACSVQPLCNLYWPRVHGGQPFLKTLKGETQLKFASKQKHMKSEHHWFN